MFLSGVSTRILSLISRRLIGRSISHEEVSRANREPTEAIERWRMRDLSREPMKYLFLDGVNFKMLIGSSVEQGSVLVAVGVTLGDHRKVLGLQSGEKESVGCWRQAFSVPSAPAIAQVFDRLPFLKRCTLFNP